MPVIIVVLLAKTARSDMHPASYVFGTAGIVNQTGGWNTGIAFLFGLLSVQWTVRGYPFLSFVSLMSSPDDRMLLMHRDDIGS
jgi:ABC-type Mn2+/Zn2+ transport system permease subunit